MEGLGEQPDLHLYAAQGRQVPQRQTPDGRGRSLHRRPPVRDRRRVLLPAAHQGQERQDHRRHQVGPGRQPVHGGVHPGQAFRPLRGRPGPHVHPEQGRGPGPHRQEGDHVRSDGRLRQEVAFDPRRRHRPLHGQGNEDGGVPAGGEIRRLLGRVGGRLSRFLQGDGFSWRGHHPDHDEEQGNGDLLRDPAR